MIEIQALGPLDLRDEDGPLESVLAQPKRAALLAYLVLGRPRGYQTRDALLALFWPESDDARARNALSQSLFYLRRELPADVLVTRGSGDVGVDPAAVQVDVFAFEEAVEEERWEKALELYRGELLTGLHVSDAPGFERWLDLERVRLREWAAKAAWALARDRIAGGEPIEAERAAQRALGLAPTDETPVREFVAALAATGERAAALRFYDRFRAILEEELEVEPSAETAGVAEAVRAGDVPEAGAASRRPHGTGAVAAAGSSAPPTATDPAGATGRADSESGRRGSASGGTRSGVVKARQGRRRWIVLAVLAALAVAAGVASWSGGSPERTEPRVMVVPFENQTGDAALDPLGQMVADWISNGLMQVDGIDIVPHAMVVEALTAGGERRASRPPGLRRVAGTMGAGVAVMGSFYRRAGDIEFHAQVVDLESSEPIATIEPVRAPSADPIQGIDPLLAQVGGALAARLIAPVALELPPTAEPPTYASYLAYLNGLESWILADYRTAGRWFEEAFARDTTYLRALMWTWISAVNSGDTARSDSLETILRSRREELPRYDQHWLDLYYARTHGDRQGAIDAARSAVKLNPTGPLRIGLVVALVDRNRPVEARQQLEDWLPGLGAGTRYFPVWLQYAEVLHLLQDFETEMEVSRWARTELPAGQLYLAAAEARALVALGDLDAFDRRIVEIDALADGIARGEILESLALELRAHDHGAASLALADDALRWHGTLTSELRQGRKGRQLLASLLYVRERWSEAADHWAAVEADAEGPDLMAAVGRRGAAEARAGNRAAAEMAMRRLDTLESGAGPLGGQAALHRARIVAVLGDRERAVGLLRRAFAEGLAFGIWVHRDMDLEALRGMAEYERLVAPAG